MDVGATLRRARTRKGLTIEQLARSTKINASILEALENNDFDRLPASVYTRGFLRSYAREVDLHPEDTVEQYLEQFETAPPIVFEPAEPVQSPEYADSADEAPRSRTIVIDPRQLPIPALAAIALALAVGGYFVFARQGADSGVATTAEAANSASAPAPAQQPEIAQVSNVTPDVLRVEIKATGPCWVSATADRESALSRLMQAGDVHALEARDELVLRVGDPSTVTVVVNGVAARPLGRAGQPVTVQINKQNFREFQAAGL
jgi:cytoskeletal protein RodZ